MGGLLPWVPDQLWTRRTIGALVTALVLSAPLSGCSGDDATLPTAEVERGEFRVTLAIPGELEAVSSVSITAPNLHVSTKVTKIVEDGARVKEGDVLVEFETAELETRLEDEQSKYKVATTKIDQKNAQLAVQMADQDDAVVRSELDLERAKMRVTDSETVPRVERESAKLDVQGATIAVDRARKAAESARLQGEAELELLVIEASRAEANVKEAQDFLEKAVIIAPADGIVTKKEIWHGGKESTVEEGDTVWRGSQLLELPDLSEMQVIGWVHELDAGLVAVDQGATVIIDAHPDPTHEATIQKLAELAVKRRPDSKVKHLKVTVKLKEATSVMKPGMTTRVEILVEAIADVLFIPQEAIFHDEDVTFVYERGLTGWKRTSVELGRTNDTHVVVTAGLEEGATVALSDPELREAGKRDPAAIAGEPSGAP